MASFRASPAAATGALAWALLAAAPTSAQIWPALDSPPAPSGGGEKDAALVVGIAEYADVAPVAGAVQNAEAWYAYLTRTLKVPAPAVTLLRDKQAIVDRMRSYAAQAARDVKPGGTLWFVFIGHGAPAKDGKDGVLVGYDAQQDPDVLYARSLAQKELLAALGQGAQTRTVVILDACFSGRGRDGAALIPGLQPLIALQTGATTAAAGTVILTAARADQFAGPLTGTARPAFSYLVLGALRGWGDADGDGGVTATEAAAYARDALRASVKDRSQTPEISGARAGEVLARSAGEKAPDVTAIVLATRSRDSGKALPGVKVGSSDDCIDEPSCRKLAECQAGDARACDKTATLVTVEADTPPGEARVIRLRQRACDKGYLPACVTLAYSLQVSKFAKDPARVAALHGKACDGGELAACNALAGLYTSGMGVPRDPGKALALQEKVCRQTKDQNELWTCQVVAVTYQFGNGVPKNVERALELYRRACDGGLAPACQLHDDLKDPRAALARRNAKQVADWETGCNGSDADACASLGGAYQSKQYGLARDLGRAMTLFERACKGGSFTGCTSGASLANSNEDGWVKDPARMLAFHDRSCALPADGIMDRAIGAMCAVAARMHRDGVSGSKDAGKDAGKDAARAREQWKRACELGHDDACKEAR